METDYLGLKAGTIRGLGAIASIVYIAAFFGYNLYAQLTGHQAIASLPHMDLAYGYMLYYLGLRSDMPGTGKFGSVASAVLTKVFTRPSVASGQDLPLPSTASVTQTTTHQMEVEVAPTVDQEVHDQNQQGS